MLDHPGESVRVDTAMLGYLPAEQPRRFAWPLAAATIIALSLGLWVAVFAAISALRLI